MKNQTYNTAYFSLSDLLCLWKFV